MNDDSNKQDPKQSLDSSLESAPPEEILKTDVPPAEINPEKSTLKHVFDTLAQRSSIYLPIFAVLIIVVGILTYVDYHRANSGKPALSQQNLTPSALSRIANSNEIVGASDQVLTVQSSSVFNGQVLVRSDLQVAGKLQVGGSLTLTGIVVSGNSVFDTVQINKNLSVGGNASVQGTLAVQNDLSVNGSGTFGGIVSAPQITTSSLQVNGDLILTHHITAGGPIPGHTTGDAVGSGGTSSVSGSDSSGTININAGNGAYAGCYITVNFVSAFNSTPHVLVTPVGSSSATLSYYVTRATTSFSLCSNNAPTTGQSYTYDYFIVD